MNLTLLQIILICGLIGGFSGLIRLITGSKPTTSRTVSAYMLNGMVMASAGACFGVVYLESPYPCLGLSVILGMTGEQIIIVLLDLGYRLGLKYIDKLK